MTEEREAPSLRPPPERAEDLAEFPRAEIGANDTLWRVARRGKSPWWFSSSMAGRFHLPEPDGTCYLAKDDLAALLEVVGPDRNGGTVSPEFIARRRIHRLRPGRSPALADLTARKAAAFGVTHEIHTIVPYDLPQAWAARLHQSGFDGLCYFARHDPASSDSLALFGESGEDSARDPGTGEPIGEDRLRRLTETYGIRVVDVPRSAELTID